MRRKWIRELCTVLTVSGADNDAVIAAIDDVRFRDFEDALQDRCAVNMTADYIVTANIKDFAGLSTTPAVTPDDFLAMIGEE